MSLLHVSGLFLNTRKREMLIEFAAVPSDTHTGRRLWIEKRWMELDETWYMFVVEDV